MQKWIGLLEASHFMQTTLPQQLNDPHFTPSLPEFLNCVSARHAHNHSHSHNHMHIHGPELKEKQYAQLNVIDPDSGYATPTNFGGDDYSMKKRKGNCMNCKIPMIVWRMDDKGSSLCNACGLYSPQPSLPKQQKKPKKENIKQDTKAKVRQSNKRNADFNANPLTCVNCSTTETTLWRRNDFGDVVCNACGLYWKLHKRPRPVNLKSKTIRKRNRKQRTKGSDTKKVAGVLGTVPSNSISSTPLTTPLHTPHSSPPPVFSIPIVPVQGLS